MKKSRGNIVHKLAPNPVSIHTKALRQLATQKKDRDYGITAER
ncbi:MAG: hypothetical protein RPT25_02540 [Cycloclasticus sp.]